MVLIKNCFDLYWLHTTTAVCRVAMLWLREKEKNKKRYELMQHNSKLDAFYMSELHVKTYVGGVSSL